MTNSGPLTPEERSEIAIRAAEARWDSNIAVTRHGGFLELHVPDVAPLECAVLEDGTRIINQNSILQTLGRPKPAGGRDPLLPSANIQQFATDKLKQLSSEAFQYRVINKAGRAMGYNYEILPELCETYLRAREDESVFLNPSQIAIAHRCELLMRGWARVGLAALIDEATGYQEVRPRRELQDLMEKYVSPEFRPWMQVFPDVFFKQIYRLYGIEYKPGNINYKTGGSGSFIAKYVYECLPDGVLEELRRINPRIIGRARKHHQHVPKDSQGRRHLDDQIKTIIGLMKASKNKKHFDELFENWKTQQ